MSEHTCGSCKYYTKGVPDSMRKADSSNLAQWATGLCNKFFPHGYSGRRNPPHMTMVNMRCFQWESPDEIEGQEAIKDE